MKKQVSVLKVLEYDKLAYAVIVSEKDKPNYTYCIYNLENVAYKNACNLAFELGATMVFKSNKRLKT